MCCPCNHGDRRFGTVSFLLLRGHALTIMSVGLFRVHSPSPILGQIGTRVLWGFRTGLPTGVFGCAANLCCVIVLEGIHSAKTSTPLNVKDPIEQSTAVHRVSGHSKRTVGHAAHLLRCAAQPSERSLSRQNAVTRTSTQGKNPGLGTKAEATV